MNGGSLGIVSGTEHDDRTRRRRLGRNDDSEMMITDALPIDDVIDRIVRLNQGLGEFWANSHGWAGRDAANLLSRSRLDWQVSLSHSLRHWIRTPRPETRDACQILGYANLGALVEGSLRLFLSVWCKDYENDIGAIKRHGAVQDPDAVSLELLRQFFKKRIWDDVASDNWDPWIERIQRRRNAIHAFKDRDVGTHTELLPDIRNLLRFLCRINGQLPYPDDGGLPIRAPYYHEEWVFETDAPAVL